VFSSPFKIDIFHSRSGFEFDIFAGKQLLYKRRDRAVAFRCRKSVDASVGGKYVANNNQPPPVNAVSKLQYRRRNPHADADLYSKSLLSRFRLTFGFKNE
jgi:hypothetical protein